MTRVEQIAAADGAAELALSTAEPATHLIDYYIKRGYRPSRIPTPRCGQ